jgi:small subunit ribosomal protein S16
VERVGSYNPKTKERVLNAERIQYWISVGAQASGTVHNMLVTAGVVKGEKINVLPRKTPIVKEKESEGAPESAAAPESAGESDGAEALQEETAPESGEEQVADAPAAAEEAVGEAPAEEEAPVAAEPEGEKKES